MFITSVIIVLREILEAALLISIYLALSNQLHCGLRWLFPAIVGGLFVAIVYGLNIAPISDCFDGVGQEVVNALMQFAIVLLMLLINGLVSAPGRHRYLTLAIAISIVLALSREGSEIYIYLSGFVGNAEHMRSVGAGALLGAGIGFSIGALFYYFLVALQATTLRMISLVALSLVAAGMSSQGINLLTQADWLPAQPALFSTEQWLPEGSIPGQLLYALIGYESTPSSLQLTGYIITVLLMLGSAGIGYLYQRKTITAKH